MPELDGIQDAKRERVPLRELIKYPDCGVKLGWTVTYHGEVWLMAGRLLIPRLPFAVCERCGGKAYFGKAPVNGV